MSLFIFEKIGYVTQDISFFHTYELQQLSCAFGVNLCDVLVNYKSSMIMKRREVGFGKNIWDTK